MSKVRERDFGEGDQGVTTALGSRQQMRDVARKLNKLGTPEKRRLQLLETYDWHAHAITNMHKHERVSCIDSCHGCCRMAVSMTTPEAELIIHRYPKVVERLLGKLREHSDIFNGFYNEMAPVSPHSAEGAELLNARWWPLRKYCAFLEDGRCSIYEARPMACRNYHVKSDPALCYRDENVEVVIVLPVSWETAAQAVVGTQPGGAALTAHLPDAVLFAWKYLKP